MRPDGLPATVLAEFRDELRRRFGADLLDVRLFGSYARGEADEDSDLDVFVLLREVSWATRREVLDLAGDLFARHGLLVSPTVFDAARYDAWRLQERPLVMDVEREGIPL
jgi:predicted nucleotidyltransferase